MIGEAVHGVRSDTAKPLPMIDTEEALKEEKSFYKDNEDEGTKLLWLRDQKIQELFDELEDVKGNTAWCNLLRPCQAHEDKKEKWMQHVDSYPR